MTRLSVNVNKVATLRNTRPRIGIPSVLRAAVICLEAGAHGITVHPRPDERHIKPRDVDELADLLKGYPQAEYNIEGNPFQGGYMEHAQRVRPTQCTLVPDTTEAATSDHGWDLSRDAARLRPIIARLKSVGCRVSLFMDASPSAMAGARAVGADRVELYTEPYAAAFARGDADATTPYAAAAQAAREAGLDINAGHDLNLLNLPPLLRAIPSIAEVSIGHALIADALEMGLAEAVRRYLLACRG
jgi:pyridoxine 5-phosphate synthase